MALDGALDATKQPVTADHPDKCLQPAVTAMLGPSAVVMFGGRRSWLGSTLTRMGTEAERSAITIEANESGRLWLDDPDAWSRLCEQEGCGMCGEEPHPEWILAETESCRISAWPEAVLPGYACVISTRHVVGAL